MKRIKIMARINPIKGLKKIIPNPCPMLLAFRNISEKDMTKERSIRFPHFKLVTAIA
jgi:hypothetical protein